MPEIRVRSNHDVEYRSQHSRSGTECGTQEKVPTVDKDYETLLDHIWNENLEAVRDWLRRFPKLDVNKVLRNYTVPCGNKSHVDNNHRGKLVLPAITAVHLAATAEDIDVLKEILGRGGQHDKIVVNGVTPLHLAAITGCVSCVEHLLNAGASVAAVTTEGDALPTKWPQEFGCYNVSGSTALHGACQGRFVNCLQLLLKRGSNVNCLNEKHLAPLHIASSRNSQQCVAALLEVDDVHPNIVDRAGNTALHSACRKSFPQIVSLLRPKVDPNIQNVLKDTALHEACRFSPQCFSLLYHKDNPFPVNPNIKNIKGDTPLHEACRKNFPLCVRLLVKEGKTGGNKVKDNADLMINVNEVNDERDTPLHEACRKKASNCVSILLDAKAKGNVSNKRGNTPLHEACRRRDHESVQMLLKKGGANPNVKNDVYRDTPLHEACWTNAPKCVKLLLNSKADPNSTNSLKNTPLHDACRHGFVECVRVLVYGFRKPNLNLKNNDGDTPLHEACRKSSLECVCILIENGASCDRRNNNDLSPLLVLSLEEDKIQSSNAIIKVLADHNADVNYDTPTQPPILLRAVSAGAVEVVRTLVKNTKLDPDVTDADGKTAFHLAAEKGHREVLTLLLEAERFRPVLFMEDDICGSTPLHLAASNGNWKSLKLIMSNDFAKTLVASRDVNGNTPLHVAAQSQDAECVKILLEYGAELTDVNRLNETALNLITKNFLLPTILIGEYLDTQIKRIDTTSEDVSQQNMKIRVCCSIFVPPQNEQDMGETDNVKCDALSTLHVIAELNQHCPTSEHSLLRHPLLEAYLYLSWFWLRPYLWSILITHIVFAASLTICLFNIHAPHIGNITVKEVLNDTRSEDVTNRHAWTAYVLIPYFISLTFGCLLLLYESFQYYVIVSRRCTEKPYLTTMLILKICCFFLAFIVPVVNVTETETEVLKCITAITTFLIWVWCAFSMGQLPSFSIDVHMFWAMAKSVLFRLLIFVFILFAYAFSFFFIFHNDIEKEEFAHPWSSIMKVMVLWVGEVDFKAIFFNDFGISALLTDVFLIMFIVTCCIILVNFLVGLAVNEIVFLRGESRYLANKRRFEFLQLIETLTSCLCFRKLRNAMDSNLSVREIFVNPKSGGTKMIAGKMYKLQNGASLPREIIQDLDDISLQKKGAKYNVGRLEVRIESSVEDINKRLKMSTNQVKELQNKMNEVNDKLTSIMEILTQNRKSDPFCRS